VHPRSVSCVSLHIARAPCCRLLSRWSARPFSPRPGIVHAATKKGSPTNDYPPRGLTRTSSWSTEGRGSVMHMQYKRRARSLSSHAALPAHVAPNSLSAPCHHQTAYSCCAALSHSGLHTRWWRVYMSIGRNNSAPCSAFGDVCVGANPRIVSRAHTMRANRRL
jgi:hypothetical protein